MYHLIEFASDTIVDLELSRKQPFERVYILKGTRLRAKIKPHVIETHTGPIEVADLFFEDGTATSDIPFAQLAFVES